jgi:hypothetical protein
MINGIECLKVRIYGHGRWIRKDENILGDVKFILFGMDLGILLHSD